MHEFEGAPQPGRVPAVKEQRTTSFITKLEKKSLNLQYNILIQKWSFLLRITKKLIELSKIK